MANKTWIAVGAGLCIVAVGAVAVAFASDWGGRGGWMRDHGRGHAGSHGVARLIEFDANEDGRITRAEIDAGLDAQFRSADTNGDGKLDPAEFQKLNDAFKADRKARFDAWRAAHPDQADKGKQGPDDRAGPGGRAAFDPFKHMDWNLDGYITPEEFASRTRAQAMRADRDGNGTIMVEDLKKNGHGRHRGDKGEAPADTTAPASENQR